MSITFSLSHSLFSDTNNSYATISVNISVSGTYADTGAHLNFWNGVSTVQYSLNYSSTSGSYNTTISNIIVNPGQTGYAYRAYVTDRFGTVAQSSQGSFTATLLTQTAPAAPTLLSKTSISITLATQTGCEYNKDGGTYQASTSFGGLTASTPYDFQARRAATSTKYASSGSSSTRITTNATPVTIVTVTFSGNGGGTPSPTSQSATVGSTYGSLATVSRTGYSFNGWYTASSGGTRIYTSTTVTNNSNHTLYAQWIINMYSITFNSNGGTAVGTITQNYNTAITAPVNPTKTGQLFGGWIPSVPSVMPANDTACVAQWNYLVSYNGNSNTGGTVPTAHPSSGSTATVASGTPSRTGYTFAGWFLTPSVYWAGNTITGIASAITLTALWNAIPTPPSTPTNVTASTNRTTDIRITWTASTNSPTGYRIYESTTSGGAYSLLATVGAVVVYHNPVAPLPTITNTTLTATNNLSDRITLNASATFASQGAARFYKVEAYNNGGSSSPSTASGGGSIAAGGSFYKILRGATEIDNTASYSDTNFAVYPGFTAPSGNAPTSVTLDSVTDTSIRVNWSGASTNNSSTVQYNLEASNEAGALSTANANGSITGNISGYTALLVSPSRSKTSVSTPTLFGLGIPGDPSLTSNTQHCFRVRTNVSNGTNSVYSSPDVCATTLVQTFIPTIISNAATSIGLNVATLHGSVADTGNLSVTPGFDYGLTTSFGIGVSASPTPITVNSTNFSANTQANLAYNTLYYFQAKGTNTAGTGYSDAPHKTFVTKAGQATAPSHSTTAYRNQNLQVSWNSSGLSGSKYDLQIQYRDDTLTWLAWQDAVANILAFEVNVLITTQSTYNQVRFRIRSYNSNNVITEGLESTPASLATIVIPTVSTSAQQAGDSTTSTVTFRGNLSSLGGASQVSTSFKYSFESDFGYGLSTGLVNTGSIGAFDRSLTISAPSENVKVNYHAHASNAAGSTTGVNVMSINTLAAKPGPPYYQSQAAYGANMTVLWTNVSSATKYQLHRQYGTETTWPVDWVPLGDAVSGVSFITTTDTNHKRIRFKVSALNRDNQENMSDPGLPSSLVVQAVPAMQTNSALSVLPTSATLGGTVLNIGGSGLQVTSSFEYGTTLSYGSVSGTTLISTNGAIYSHTIPTSGSLLSNQQYNFRAKGVNTVGTSYGANNTFVTKAAAATNITITGSIIREQIIGISWTDPGSNSAKDYRLVANYYDLIQGDWTLLSYSSYTIGTSLTYTLLSNTTYSKVRFAINTRNSLDETTSSGWDNINGHTLGSLITPLRPTNVTYIINGLDVTINFTKGTNATSTALYLTGSPTTTPALPIPTIGSSISFSFPLLESNYNTLHTGHLESYYEDHNTVSDPDTAVSFTTGKIPQTAPNAPSVSLSNISNNSIIITPPGDCGVNGCQYSKDLISWQTDVSFAVSADTKYEFYARKVGSTTHEFSLASPSSGIYLSKRNPPTKPWVNTGDLGNNFVTLRSDSGAYIISNTQTKPQGSKWEGLTAGGDYIATAHYPVMASPAKPISAYSEEFYYTTRLNPEIPTLYAITHSSITLNSLVGCEFTKNGTVWLAPTEDVITFSGLSSLTPYQFKSRYIDTPGAESAWSATFRTPPGPPISPYVDLIVEKNVTIMWEDHDTNVYTQISHNILFNTFISISPSINTYTFTAATYNMTGRIYLRHYSQGYNLIGERVYLDYTIPKGEQTAPVAPTIGTIQENAIALIPFSPTADYEYSRNSEPFVDNHIFEFLNANSEHAFRARKKSNAYYNASPASPSTAATYTLSGAPSVPTHISQTYYSEVIPVSWTNGTNATGTKLLYSYYNNSVWTTFTPVTGSGYHSSPYQFTITSNTDYKQLRFRANSYNTSLAINSSLPSNALDINVAPLPVFTTSNAQNITDVSATLTGIVTDIGASTVQEAFFKYGLATPGNLNSTSTLNITSAPVEIQHNVASLNRNALYYFALTGYNAQGSPTSIAYETFRTLAGAPSIPTHLLKAGWNKPLVVSWTNGLSATSHLVQIQYFDTTDPNPSFHGWTVFSVGVALTSGGSITIANNNKYTQARVRIVSLNALGAQNIGPVGQTVQLGGRPEHFNWSVNKTPQGPAVVTAEEWNRLIDHIQAMWIHVGVTPTHTMTRPVQNQTGFTALIANQIINGINFMFDPIDALPNVAKNDPVLASWFLSIITKLDSII